MNRKLATNELQRLSPDEVKQASKLPLIVVLENIRSAYNVGSVFRTADAFLLEAVYLCGYTCYPPHKEIRKTALGAEDVVAWKHFPTTAAALADLAEQGYTVFAVEQAEGSHSLESLPRLPEKTAIVLGNEVTGVEQSTIAQTAGCLEIPQLGMKHSLNIATAAGVVIWELVREQIATRTVDHKPSL